MITGITWWSLKKILQGIWMIKLAFRSTDHHNSLQFTHCHSSIELRRLTLQLVFSDAWLCLDVAEHYVTNMYRNLKSAMIIDKVLLSFSQVEEKLTSACGAQIDFKQMD